MTIVTVPAIGQYGVIRDQASQELPRNAWSNALNMRFREGRAERFLGQRQLFTTSDVVPLWLQQYNQATKRWWVHAGASAIYADSGSDPRATITPSPAPSGTVDDRWTGGSFNGVLITNNGVDVPWYWTGSGVMLALPNWPAQTRVRSLRPYKNYLVGLNVTKNWSTTKNRYPHMVKWSTEADPGSVPPTYDETDVTQNAGEVDLAEEQSMLVDQLPLGNANIIYKENAIYSMLPTGGNEIFTFQRARDASMGLLAPGCVTDTPLGHVFLSAGDVMLFDGQQVKSISTAVLRTWLFRTIDSANRERSFVTRNPQASEVWICIPELGEPDCTIAAVWNWEFNTWAIRELPHLTTAAVGQLEALITSTWSASDGTWDDATLAWNQEELTQAQQRLMLAGANRKITVADTGSTFDGQPYTSMLERINNPFDAPDKVKTIRSISPRIAAAPGTKVRIEVGGSMDTEVAPTWQGSFDYEVGQSYKADLFATGRFLAYRITSLDNQPWSIRSMDIDMVVRGAA